MTADPGFFEAFYHSPAQHPWLLWAAVVFGLGFCLARTGIHRSLHRYAVALGLLAALDAWLTSSHVYGLGELPEALRGPVPLFFVLAGDFRYLLLAIAAQPDGRVRARRRQVLAALALTAVVPVGSQLAVWAFPDALESPRHLFLIYELAFFALAGALLEYHPNVARAPWLRALSRYVMVYYGLWASADAILLVTGSDLGFALRVVPNLLYYGGLIAAIGWFAPVHSPASVEPAYSET